MAKPDHYVVVGPNHNVVGIVVWDGDEKAWSPEAAFGKGHKAVARPDPDPGIEAGWTYSGGKFKPPSDSAASV